MSAFVFTAIGQGQYFKMDGDSSYQRNAYEASELSLLICLNDYFEGGCTQFSWDKVQPKAGRVLVFPHHLLHQGKEVIYAEKRYYVFGLCVLGITNYLRKCIDNFNPSGLLQKKQEI